MDASIDAVQALRKGILEAKRLGSVKLIHAAVRAAIETFETTEYAKRSKEWVRDRGYALVPLLSRAEAQGKLRSMNETVEEKLLHKVSQGIFAVPETLKAQKIQSQRRYMIHELKQKLGWEFAQNASDMAQTVAFVLQALEYGSYIRVNVEKLTLLLSAAGGSAQVSFYLVAVCCCKNNNHILTHQDGSAHGSPVILLARVGDTDAVYNPLMCEFPLYTNGSQIHQVLHTDIDPKHVLRRMTSDGSGSRQRCEPPPFSGLLSLQEGTNVYVIEGSHHSHATGTTADGSVETEFSWCDAKELTIPPSWGLLFSSCLVHAGGTYELPNGRIHCYFKDHGGSATFDGKIKMVKQIGELPVAKTPANRNNL